MTDDEIPDRYRSTSPEQALAHVAEECAEFLAAHSKAMRWGWQSVNPELPPEQQETNHAWAMRELADVERAIAAFRKMERDDQDAAEQSTVTWMRP